MKKNIAIIMGGYSSEREISLRSGSVVFKNLDKDTYNLYRVDITQGDWFYFDDNGVKVALDKNDFSLTLDGKKIKFDCVFNAIHGTPGENGLLAAYFELTGVPHTSCDFFQAALTFNKRECIAIAKQYGVAAAESVFIAKGDKIDAKAIAQKVGLPCFVKPNCSGSSFGISKVHKVEDIPAALEVAFKEDHNVLVESFLKGREVTVGVMRFKGEIKVLPITEIISMNDFFDYQAKYEGLSKEITPADLTVKVREALEEVAVKVYKSLNLKGITRTEYIIVEGVPHLLEVNTTPGLSEASIVPQQAACAGISLKELFGSLVQEALRA